MEKFTKLTGVAAPLPMINVDTDMIIPKQFLKTIKRTGLGRHLFVEMRYDADGSENPDFVLNQPAYRKAKILVDRREFRLRVEPRARAVGAAGFRHPLRHRAQLRRHLLQQLLQERHPADRAAAGGRRQADGRCRARRQRHRQRRSRKAGDHRPRRRHDPVRDRSVPQALPPQRPRRYRPDAGRRAASHRRLRSAAARRPKPWL